MKGKRLAVALRPRWPRWGSLALATFTTGAWIFVLLGYAFFGGDEVAPHRTVVVAVLAGGFSLICIVGWVTTFVPWLLAGDTTVEVSRQPVSPGQDFEYFILQGRDHSSIRQIEATLLCRRQEGHGLVEVLVQVLLPPPEIDAGGRQASLRGTLRLPDGPPSSAPPDHIKVHWLIEIRTTFGRKYRFKEEFPLKVDEKPPAA